MATDAAEVVGSVRSPCSVKVHRMMCTELMSLVDRISSIFPKLEEARPGSSSGIQALCLLNAGIEKANELLRSCSDGSRLYLALTGDAIVSRFKQTRSVLEQSLSQIQDMVPVTLAVEFSQIVDDLSRAAFVMDPSEEEAGNVLKELLQQGTSASDSMETSEIRSLQTAASRLHITSPRAILIERRSIKKLLDKVGARESTKRKILTYFMYLLKKYGDFILAEQTESPLHQDSSAFENSGNGLMYNQVEPRTRRRENEVESNFMGRRRPVPPEEFRCPISSRLMYDPVVIASGQTYERMWIQKWFDEGHDTCPKTDMKLPHMSSTPNVIIKELITSWCTKYGVTISDPTMQPALNRWETSSNDLHLQMDDLLLQMDLSNISLGSIDASYDSDNGLIIMERPVPPEEFRCPISSRIMYDPVIIASGQTYERMWIQKWFDEGHDTCYKTGMKLTHMSLAPNIALNASISGWCTKYGVTIYDSRMHPESLYSWETSLDSLASFSSYMNDLDLQMDLSNISVGSIDDSDDSNS